MADDDFNVPTDFPRPVHLGAVGGFQPKLLLTKAGDKFHSPGCAPEELHARWQVCEHLAQQFVVKARETKAGKRSHMAEQDILEQYLVRSMKMNWGSTQEMRWVFRRAATLLSWPAPSAALVTDE
jgi:hypothetical protein